MSSIINIEYFNGTFFYIPNNEDSNLGATLLEHIQLHEDLFLTELLGYELYRDFILAIDYDADPITTKSTADAKWKLLLEGGEFVGHCGRLNKWWGFLGYKHERTFTECVDGVNTTTTKEVYTHSQIANYVYWQWMHQHSSLVSGVGVYHGETEKGVRTNPMAQMVRAWNQMVDMNNVFHQFMLAHKSEFPTYIGSKFSHLSPFCCGEKTLSGLYEKQNTFRI